jgi:hypothetical protein
MQRVDIMKTLVAKVARKLGDRPAKMAFALTNTSIIRNQLGRSYEGALKAHHPDLPLLSASDREVVDALQTRGIYVTSLAALGLQGSDDLLRRAQRAAGECADTARQQAADGQEFTCVPPAAIFEDAEIFKWGVSDRLLDIAEGYLGLPVAYDGLSIIYTVADGRDGGTRDWHRDREDRKMLKVAVYCNDVGEGGGPFQMISRLDKAQCDASGYRYAGGAEEELVSTLGADYREDIVTSHGAAGTVIFVDTARYFHRGEPVFTEDRSAIFYSYFSQQTRHPFFCHRSGMSPKQLAELAQGMSPRQRSAILWQQTQPLWSRLVPPAPV